MEQIQVLQAILCTLFIITLLHSIKSLGPNKTIVFLTIVLVVGLTVERVLAQGLTHNLGGMQLGSVPILILTSWWTVVYYSMALTNKLFARKSALILLVASDTSAALGFDIVVDPIANWLGIWKWNPPGVFFGVPLENFLLWIVAVGTISIVMRRFVYGEKL